jgi:hypothetical protein
MKYLSFIVAFAFALMLGPPAMASPQCQTIEGYNQLVATPVQQLSPAPAAVASKSGYAIVGSRTCGAVPQDFTLTMIASGHGASASPITASLGHFDTGDPTTSL